MTNAYYFDCKVGAIIYVNFLPEHVNIIVHVISWVFFIFTLKFRYLESLTSSDWPKKYHNYVTIWSQLQALRRLTECLLSSVVVECLMLSYLETERSQVLISALKSPSPTQVNPSSRKGIWLTSEVDHSRLIPHLLQFVTHKLFFRVILRASAAI